MDNHGIVQNIRDGKDTVIELDGETFSFEPEAFLMEAKSPEHYVALEEAGCLAALNTQLTPELVQEGLLREVVRLIQNGRKQAGLDVSDQILLGISASGELLNALKADLDFVKHEVLAQDVSFEVLEDAEFCDRVTVGDAIVSISLKKIEFVSSSTDSTLMAQRGNERSIDY
jgi:isoleucyl-tRNA synthetase